MSIKTKIIGFKELRQNADKYINAVAKGKSFTVIRRSRPIFKIMPVDEWGDEGSWETVIDFRGEKNGGVEMSKFTRLLENSLSNERKRKISS